MAGIEHRLLPHGLSYPRSWFVRFGTDQPRLRIIY